MTGRSRRRDREDGSVLVLLLGFVVVLALVVAVVADAGRVFLARRSLDAVTDAAALAGAQAIDLDAVYAGESGRDLHLDEREARRAVERHLVLTGASHDLEGFRVEDVEVDALRVTVRTSSTVRVPLTAALTGRRTVTVETVATARNRLID